MAEEISVRRCKNARAAARAAWCAAVPSDIAWETAVAALASLLSLPHLHEQKGNMHSARSHAWEALMESAVSQFELVYSSYPDLREFREALLATPPTPLPPPLLTSDGGFTADTMRRRVPAILKETLAASQAPADLVTSVHSQICAPLLEGLVLTPPKEEDEENLWAPHSSLCVESFWYQENAVYRHLLRLWREHGQGGKDPFSAQKEAALCSAKDVFCASLAASGEACHPGAPAASLRSGLLNSLWGNRADLSLSAGKVVPGLGGSGSGGGKESDLLCDHSHAVTSYLLEEENAGCMVCTVLDNCGMELLQDLRLVDSLLSLGFHVTLHAKRWPTYVSDATEKDVYSHIDWLEGAGHSAAALKSRLRSALSANTLIVRSSAFWNSGRPAWAMPVELEEWFSGLKLAIFKGDANYRRLLGDMHWPHSMPFARVLQYAPCATLALRTAKCGLAVGISELEEARAIAESPSDWLTSGKYGLIQFTGV